MKESSTSGSAKTLHQDSFLHAFKEFIHKFRLVEREESIIVAVSGGLDSIVLLDAFEEIKKEIKLHIAVAHFNHELREKDSDEDEAFVRAAAKERGLECYVEHANTASVAESKKLSIQETARDLRYTFLNKLRSSLGYQKIATVHHADDNAETVLFNIFRGAGVHGLSGIPAFRKDISLIRPFLFATREQIEEYAKTKSLLYREDSTNIKNEYTRNFLRNSVIPLIHENINPNLTATLRRTAELFEQLEQYLKDEAMKVLLEVIIRRSSKEIVLDMNKFHMQPVFLQEHLLLHIAKDFTKVEIDFTSVKTMLKISHAETGTSCSISKDTVFYRNRDHLIFKHVPNTNPFLYRITPNKMFEFESFQFNSAPVVKASLSDDPCVEYVDAASLGKELILRSWNEGDWFVPLGMNEKKKLSDFFIDQKIPLFEKQIIPILMSDGDIVWVCGKRLDDRYKITPKTTSILKLEYIPRNNRP